MGRGKHFDHKKKNHPGKFPEDTLVERHTTEAQEDEELLVTQVAFKNRIEHTDELITIMTKSQGNQLLGF